MFEQTNFWNQNVPMKKPVNMMPSKTEMRNFGLDHETGVFVEKLEDLRKDPPHIVIAKSLRNFAFIQNWFKKQELKKNGKYVMSIGVYNQLKYGADQNNINKKFLAPAELKFKNFFKPYMGQDLTDKTLLVFRTGGIGDLLFIQPNLHFLKSKYPTCIIKFACGPQYQCMVETWDCVDKVLDLPFSFMHLIESDYHALFEGVIERCKEAHTTNAYHLFTKWLGLNLPDELLIPKQKPKDQQMAECIEILEKWGIFGKSFILIQLRASSPIRTPSHKFWIKIINELTNVGHNVVITDNPIQSKNISRFIDMVDNKERVFNFCEHSKSLDYTIALTQCCGITLSTDSALCHIAASLNKPCYGLYGPFPGHIRLKTYPKARWVDAERHCAPCFIHSQTPCPQADSDKYSPCYYNIDVDKVVKEIGEMIE